METSSNITFVTAFMNVYKSHTSPYQGRDKFWRLERFMKIAEIGIPICVYVDESGEELLKQCIELFPNTIKIMRVMSIYDTWAHRICQQYDSIVLPKHRNDIKDNYEYMVLMNSKIEFVYDTIKSNPFKTTHFAWIDFNVAHIFKDVVGTQAYLKTLTTCVLPRNRLWIPGCWSPLPKDPSQDIIQTSVLDGIHWRFCGGFFLGDIQVLEEFHQLYETWFPEFIFRYKKMVWEVNFWSWLEAISKQWSPCWFLADHDDSIVKIPLEHLTICLKLDIPSYQEQVYDYMSIETFVPMSACVVEMPDGRIGLNTRYVNYTLSPEGYYIFHHPDRVIITKNVFSILDTNSLVPISYQEVVNPVDLPYKQITNHGVEDVRLWAEGDHIHYIGTTISYSPSGKNRMITGIMKYDSGEYMMVENKILEPPTDTNCEKNWIPILSGVVNGSQLPRSFIYKWAPLEIGHINNGTLVIDDKQDVAIPIFHRLRGSTIFSEYKTDPRYLIGLAHYSEKEWPRSYYHILILLDRKTYKPVTCSQPFSFYKQNNIEYCIGFLEREYKYHFWVSRYDRDPIHISVSKHAIPFCV